ncbi:MAG: hypothetical protein P8J86_03865 [Phycisphaerales bacterium]|nr:hypothetical protein [Phycisphaerales bacterium]
MMDQPPQLVPPKSGRLFGGFGAALIFSIAFHFFILIPVVLLILSPQTSAREVADDLTEVPDQREPPPPLGGEEGSPSSLVWIGYDTYQEHLAELAEVEQAAFTPSPMGAPNATPNTVNPSTPGEENTGEDQQTTPAIQEPVTATAQGNPDKQDNPEKAQQSEGLIKAPISEQGAQKIPMTPILGPGPLILMSLPEATNADASETQEPTPNQEPQKPETAAPGQAETPTSKEAEPGTPADRESDATSTIKVPINKWKLGRPLQAEGYEILTSKPQLTPLQQVSGTLGMRKFPVVEIVFLNTGRPDDVRVIQSSGNSRADEILRQSVFKWRAQGKAIEERAKDDPLIVRIQITFTRRRR